MSELINMSENPPQTMFIQSIHQLSTQTKLLKEFFFKIVFKKQECH